MAEADDLGEMAGGAPAWDEAWYVAMSGGVYRAWTWISQEMGYEGLVGKLLEALARGFADAHELSGLLEQSSLEMFSEEEEDEDGRPA